jgi:hypothetical protein
MSKTETGKRPNRGPKRLPPVFRADIPQLDPVPRREGVSGRAGTAPRVLNHDTRGGER